MMQVWLGTTVGELSFPELSVVGTVYTSGHGGVLIGQCLTDLG